MPTSFTFEGDQVAGVPGPAAAAVAGDCLRTWLSVDEWANIMGINPLHFNGLSHPTLSNTVCGEVFFEHAWQHSDRVGREEIRLAIKQAEEDIAREAGFNLMPDWTIAERLPYPRPRHPEVYGFGGYNPRFMLKSVELPRGYILSGGVRTKAVISSGVAIARTDADSDQFQETCMVTAATSVTDPNEIHLYYPGKSGDDCWEIRPISVTISGGVATIVFKVWQVVAANKRDVLDPEPLDATDEDSFEDTVDIYRVYNDPATQLQFIWENSPEVWSCGSCAACQLETQAGCFHLRDHRMGFIVPAPGSWNSDDEQFDSSEWSVCRDPDQVRVWYYSGYVDQSIPRPYAELSNYWKTTIAYYAASMLDRPVCGCSNVAGFIERWRKDAMFNSDKDTQINITPELLANKMTATMGGLYAYKRIHRNGVRVNK